MKQEKIKSIKLIRGECLEEMDKLIKPNGTIVLFGVACVNLGRNFIGIEKDRKYYKIAKKRIKDQQKRNSKKLFNSF